MRYFRKSVLPVLILVLLLCGCAGANLYSAKTATEPAGTSAGSAATTQESSAGQGGASAEIKPDGLLKAHFIDVGQADCIYIELPNSENMLIDAGNNGDRDTILDYLDSQGVKKLDHVIGTHPHEDHIGSLDAVINNYDIGKIYMPQVSSNTKTFEDVLTAIQNKGLRVTAPAGGAYLIGLGNRTDGNTVKDELAVRFLAPNGKGYKDMNNYSIVVKIIFRNTSMLFTGDAEDVSEAEMISAGYDVRSNLIKIGHHGSASSTTDSFLEDVQPQYAVISVGRDNHYGHPAQSTLDKLNAAGVRIFRTDELGTITAASDGETITFDKK